MVSVGYQIPDTERVSVCRNLFFDGVNSEWQTVQEGILDLLYGWVGDAEQLWACCCAFLVASHSTFLCKSFRIRYPNVRNRE